jgi:hypothetical protein
LKIWDYSFYNATIPSKRWGHVAFMEGDHMFIWGENTNRSDDRLLLAADMIIAFLKYMHLGIVHFSMTSDYKTPFVIWVTLGMHVFGNEWP